MLHLTLLSLLPVGLCVEQLIEDELVLEDACIAVVQEALALLIGYDKHLALLEVEHFKVYDQVGEARPGA